MTIRVLRIAFAAVLLLAACSDDDHGSPRTPTGVPTAQFTVTASAPRTPTPSTSPGDEPPPTATRTHLAGTPSTAAATATRTPTRSSGGAVAVAIGSAMGDSGDTVSFAVSLSSGDDVAGIQNDIA